MKNKGNQDYIDKPNHHAHGLLIKEREGQFTRAAGNACVTGPMSFDKRTMTAGNRPKFISHKRIVAGSVITALVGIMAFLLIH
jgi:hypothetical protein